MRPYPVLLLTLTATVLAATGCQRGTAAAAAPAATAAQAAAADPLVAEGEYLVRIAGCNDCHTPGYSDRGGEVPRSEWLVGSPLGQLGPWGTTYPTNLRLSINALQEDEWLAYTANLHTRPLMPDFAVRQMREHDRRAIYRFVRSLGPAGDPSPKALPPGQQPPPPYLQLVLPDMAAAVQDQNPVQ
jgi:mono/diheme cytochrome c family protein